MKCMRVITVTLVVLQFASCSRLYDACVRNITNEVAVIDVFLLDKTDMKTLPNKIRMTNHIVDLKKGYKKYLDSVQNVT
ncbi:MAG: hypothetical protein KF746_10745 [Chitinophagaceae bacterium]|nr:hypothetical protein [Chitinophagaceae bacterium]